jgi:hypothetical protein
MQDLRLTIRKRAFPSRGRVRLNVAHLPALGVGEGERVDLINEETKKTVTATVIADTMVREGQIRVSDDDLATLGLDDDNEVLVRRTPPLEEKVKRAVDKAAAGAGKTADTIKKETKKAADSIGRQAEKTAGQVKKAMKKKGGDTL